MDERCYEAYVGVDISDVAIETAIRRTAQNGRAAKNSYVQSDLASYQPVGLFDVVLFRESIWYIPQDRIKHVLDACRQHLKEEGVLIVRIYDRSKLGSCVEHLRRNFSVIEEYVPEESKDIVLVLR
jgi:2-polyprenyl-3-methyl-5-hydroxy-6-metoxy-1,4-benzoquinol methylase